MYLTDIRGFSSDNGYSLFPSRLRGFSPRATPDCLFLADGSVLLRAQKGDFAKQMGMSLSKITIHGMGISGSRGITTAFARFCRLYSVSPRYLSLSDMGISFFVPEEERERILDALEAYFPMWT